jgi:predicted phosphodiesterase
MQLHVKDLGDLECAYVLGLSDLHVGDPQFDAKYFDDLSKWIVATPNAYLILNGDLANCATKESKSDTYEATLSPNEQKKYLQKIFAPLKSRVLGVTEGNHEERVRRLTSIDICEDLAAFLGCPYGREGLLLQVRLGNFKGKPVSYLIYATHGWSMARGPGGKVNQAVSLATVVQGCDVYVVGHTHTKYLFENVALKPDPQNHSVMRVKQIFASSGSILDYGGYAQKKGYPPGAKGVPRLRLNGLRKDVHASI